MKRSDLLVTIFLLLGCAISFGEAGDAHLYGGGDPTDEKLASARERLRQSFGLLRVGMDSESLCTADACVKSYDPALCQAVRAMAPLEQALCRKFLSERIDALSLAAESSQSPFVLSDKALVIKEGGKSRPVGAITEHAVSKGAVTWHRETVRGMPLESILALFVHELGHRIGLDEKTLVIKDEAPLPPFVTGRKFLDAAGAAMALYAMEHSAPRQAPPAFPAGIELGKACAPRGDSVDRFLMGVAIDAERTVLGTGELSSWRALLPALSKASGEPLLLAFLQARLGSREARALEVRRLFRQTLLRAPSSAESALMVERLAAGVPYEAIVASLMGDREYATSRHADGPQQFIVAVYSDLFGRSPSYQELRRYLGQAQSIDRASTVLQIMKGAREPWDRWVTAWYRDYLNRLPSSEEADEQARRLRGGAGWEAARASILSRPEYFALQALRWERCEVGASRAVSGASAAKFPPR